MTRIFSLLAWQAAAALMVLGLSGAVIAFFEFVGVPRSDLIGIAAVVATFMGVLLLIPSFFFYDDQEHGAWANAMPQLVLLGLGCLAGYAKFADADDGNYNAFLSVLALVALLMTLLMQTSLKKHDASINALASLCLWLFLMVPALATSVVVPGLVEHRYAWEQDLLVQIQPFGIAMAGLGLSVLFFSLLGFAWVAFTKWRAARRPQAIEEPVVVYRDFAHEPMLVPNLEFRRTG